MVSYSRGAFPKVKGIVPESASCPSQKQSNCARISSHLSMSLPSLSFLPSSIPQRVDSPCHSAENYKNSAGEAASAKFFVGKDNACPAAAIYCGYQDAERSIFMETVLAILYSLVGY